jgi:hypothetical protein
LQAFPQFRIKQNQSGQLLQRFGHIVRIVETHYWHGFIDAAAQTRQDLARAALYEVVCTCSNQCLNRPDPLHRAEYLPCQPMPYVLCVAVGLRIDAIQDPDRWRGKFDRRQIFG